MPKYHIKVFRSSTAPSMPQEFSVDHFVSIDEFAKVNTDALDGPLLVYSPSTIAAMLITPASPPVPGAKPKTVEPDASKPT